MKGFHHVRGNLGERIRRLREATAATRGPAPDICADCRGTGWVVQEKDGVSRATRCECWIREKTGKLKQSTGIPVRYARCAFDGFTVYPNEDLERAFRRAKEFAARFPVRQNSLLLAGPSGIGKTHLAAAILNACADKGIGGLYCETAALLTRLRSSYDKDSGTQDTDILRRLSNADLLVVDDLGAEQLTQWGQNMLHAVLNARYNQDLATICTTRLPPSPHERDSLLFRSADGCCRCSTRCATSSSSTGPTTATPASTPTETRWKRCGTREDAARARRRRRHASGRQTASDAHNPHERKERTRWSTSSATSGRTTSRRAASAAGCGGSTRPTRTSAKRKRTHRSQSTTTS